MLSADAPDSSATPPVSVQLNQRWNEEPRFQARNTCRPRSCESVLVLRTRTTLELISTQRCALLPRSLHARLTARAKQEGVSMNALVWTYLADSLGRREGVKK